MTSEEALKCAHFMMRNYRHEDKEDPDNENCGRFDDQMWEAFEKCFPSLYKSDTVVHDHMDIPDLLAAQMWFVGLFMQPQQGDTPEKFLWYINQRGNWIYREEPNCDFNLLYDNRGKVFP